MAAKKNSAATLETLSTLRKLLCSSHERSGQRLSGLGTMQVVVVERPGTCPVCGGAMGVQKSVSRTGRTLDLGSFEARETVHVCTARCQWPTGRLVIRRAVTLAERLLPRSTVGYDVMVFVGIERFVHHRQRDEIRASLQERYGVTLSAGETSRLARLFLVYLEKLHGIRTPQLRAALEADGGWPLHIDATGEDGRGTLFVALAGWRRWVLGAWKLPTERADAVLPCMEQVVGAFGAPCAIVRDLGRAMASAANALVEELEKVAPGIQVLACHLHFLKDIGNDLLEPSHAQLRALFRRAKIRPRLRSLARDLGRSLGSNIGEAREELAVWQNTEEQGHTLPVGSAGIAAVRALTQWVVDYAADGADQGFPFDRPYFDLYQRCVRASRAADAFMRRPPADANVLRALERLRTILKAAVADVPFAQVAGTLARRARLFDELRTALRLTPKPYGRNEAANTAVTNPDKASADLNGVRLAVETLTESLIARRPKRGPAQDTRQAIDLILCHIRAHGEFLWGHAVSLSPAAGGGIRLVDRTNNCLEGFFHRMKHGERRRCGRKVLTKDFEDLPATAALAYNLTCPDYVEIVCATLDGLPAAFAALDAASRLEAQAPCATTQTATATPPPILASAALPRDDRALVRSHAMQRKVLAAATSRAPRGG